MIILLMAKPTLAMAASGGSYEPSGTTASGASITTGDGGDWEKKNAESPVTITFPSPNSSDKNYDPNSQINFLLNRKRRNSLSCAVLLVLDTSPKR